MDPAVLVEVAAMSRQRALEETTARGDSELQQFYRAATLFLTGGSGFMGKQLVEKLFRSCQISKMYLLLRPKKGKEIKERLEVIFQDPVFDTLRKLKPGFEEQVIAIEGDVAEEGLGISDQDRMTLTQEVDVIIHMAATTRFDEALKQATMINVRGTRETIALGKECTKLRSFVHVSTAYSYAKSSLIKQKVYETFYPSPIPPETLISMAETMEVGRFNGLTESLIEEWPNTYTFTKAVAEDLVKTMSDGLPICIVRPGIVVSAYREPSPGWLDLSCAYGVSGLILGSALGVLHTLHNKDDVRIGLVPCDYVNNAIIAAGKAASASTGGESTNIYFVNTNFRNPIKQDYGAEFLSSNTVRRHVTPKAVYYCFVLRTSNKLLYFLLNLFLHYIPAYVVDFVCLLLGKERRFVKIYTKIHKMARSLSYFGLNDWLFVDRNLENLYNDLSKTDKIIFNFDLMDIDWSEFLLIWVIGIRKYIIKDGLKDTEYATKKQFWLKILHYVLSAIYLYCIWKIFSVAFSFLSGGFSLLLNNSCSLIYQKI